MGLFRLVPVSRTRNMLTVWFAIKATTVGGVIYYTCDQGLWSKPEKTVQLYEKLYVNIAPYVKKNVPEEITKELAHLPSMSCISSFMKKSWNQGVMTSMEFISDIPTHTTNGVCSLYKTVKSYMKSLN